jgi:hypothetical protein
MSALVLDIRAKHPRAAHDVNGAGITTVELRPAFVRVRGGIRVEYQRRSDVLGQEHIFIGRFEPARDVPTLAADRSVYDPESLRLDATGLRSSPSLPSARARG